MKKNLLSIAIVAAFCISVHAQTSLINLIQGGNMEDATNWTVVELAAGGGHTETFNYTDDGPEGGEAGCLRMTNGGGWANVAVCQEVTIQRGVEYQISLNVKTLTDLVETWVEVVVLDNIPSTDGDFGGKPIRLALNSWDCGDALSIDGNFVDFHCVAKTELNDIVFIEGEGDTTIVLAIKAGSNGAMDILIDNVALTTEDTEPNSIATVAGSKLTIYPNPANGTIFVNSNNTSIYDITGKLMLNATGTGSKVDISSLKSGLYVVKAGNQVQKLVVK